MDYFKNNLVNQLPDVSELTFKRIHKDYLKVLVLTTLVVFFVLFLSVFLLETYVEKISNLEYVNYFYLLLSIVFLILIAVFVIGFSRRKYVLREKDISYKEGLLVKKMTTVPFSRIQHVEIDEKPVSRMFGLSSLSVYTAGDSSDDLEVKGIKKETALQIKEFISSKINE